MKIVNSEVYYLLNLSLIFYQIFLFKFLGENKDDVFELKKLWIVKYVRWT